MRFAVRVGTTLGAMSRNLHKKISLTLFFCLVFSSSFLCGQDVTPPQLVSVAFAPTQVDVTNADQVVNVDLHLTDDLSGVRDIDISFSSPVPGQSDVAASVSASSTLLSGTLNDGVFRVPVTFRQSGALGDWILFQVEVHDEAAAANFSLCLETCLNQINAPTIVTVTAVTANNPPVVTNPGTQSNEKGDSVSLQIQASDPDGDTLTYSAIGLPPGLSIGTNSGLINGTLGLDTAETYAVTVSVSDGNTSTSVNFQWLVNGTVLIANFMNGNSSFFKSRVYLWNPSSSAGNVRVRVFTLPLIGGMAQELTTTALNLGSLGAKSALNIRLEEILDLVPGITMPYETDNGNLTLELTIGATNVKGAAQVFNNSLTLAFGTYPLQAVPSTSAGSPTVLVANFLNGNTNFFKSRIYLFNPSASDGTVTLRVFTLPRTDGTAQELTTTGPHNLGTLAARSALNIRLEDILDDLSMPRPYETDAGNITLEFTIQAADVVGAAQVFNNSLTLAFGTYPMQVIQ